MAYDQERADEQRAHEELLEKILAHADEGWGASEGAAEHIAVEFVGAQAKALAVAREQLAALRDYTGGIAEPTLYRWGRVNIRASEALNRIDALMKIDSGEEG